MATNQQKKLQNDKARNLFLIDAFGALVSAFLLGVVLVKLERIFGIPPTTLYILASLPVFFALYDFYCFRKKDDNLGIYLRAIAIVNLLYCCMSIAFAFYHYEEITLLGWLYILVEIIIVALLAVVELRVAQRLIA